ncbi:MAG: hypothetical protein K5888_07840, partial [Lachnospiraceae bacterium]|nr:hypothetical protein [Lachnospiraceae bacterium]
TVFTSFKDTFKSIFDNFISVRPTAFVLLILILILISAEISHRISLKELIYVILSTFLINCGVRMPEIYVGVDVSGGVPDTYHIVFYLSLAIITVYLTGFVLQSNNDVRTRLKKICPVGLVSLLVIMVILSRHLIGNSADYMCIEYIADGSLDDYRAQMEERLKILEDDSIRDAVLPVMNEYQGPYMSFPLTDDPEQYDNTVTRNYYGKDSVIAIPRDEWNEKYK